jgi:hypothetical protein
MDFIRRILSPKTSESPSMNHSLNNRSNISAFPAKRVSMLSDMSLTKDQKVTHSLSKEEQELIKFQRILEMKRKQTEDAVAKDRWIENKVTLGSASARQALLDRELRVKRRNSEAIERA